MMINVSGMETTILSETSIVEQRLLRLDEAKGCSEIGELVKDTSAREVQKL